MNLSKRIMANVIILCISIIICNIIIELLAMIYFPTYNPSGKYDTYQDAKGLLLGEKLFYGRIWDNAGDFDVDVATNKYGFRDKKDLSLSTDEDFFAVGDSFSFGYGVAEDKRYSNLLESYLINQKVYNISVPGGDFDDYNNYIQYSRNNGATIKNLIIGICMENDLMDYNHKKVQTRRRDAVGGILGTIKDYLNRKSTAYNAITHFVKDRKIMVEILKKLWIVDDPIGIIPENKYNDAILKSSIERLREIAKPYATIILIIPSRGLWKGKDIINERRTHYEFIKLIRQERIAVIDMLAYLEEGTIDPFQTYYFPHDGHWNEKAHQKAAKAISDYIKDEGF